MAHSRHFLVSRNLPSPTLTTVNVDQRCAMAIRIDVTHRDGRRSKYMQFTLIPNGDVAPSNLSVSPTSTRS